MCLSCLPWPSTARTQTSGRSNLASLVTLDVLKLFDGFGSSIKRTRFRPNHPVSLWLLGAIRANLWPSLHVAQPDAHGYNSASFPGLYCRWDAVSTDKSKFGTPLTSYNCVRPSQPCGNVTRIDEFVLDFIRSRSCPLAATAGSRRCSFFHR